jgi:hypothetical protein
MSNLFPCFDCGNNVSVHASACPKCQTRRLRGTKCHACEETSKSSEITSILVDKKIPQIVSKKGEVKYFNYGDEIYKREWLERSSHDRYLNHIDMGDYGINRWSEIVSEHEVFHFCEACYTSIASVKKVAKIPCFSCQEPFSINLEQCILGKAALTSSKQECGSCGDSSNGYRFSFNNLKTCCNCHLNVLIDEGIEIADCEEYSLRTEYVHKVCLISFERKELAAKRNKEAQRKRKEAEEKRKDEDLARQKEEDLAHKKEQDAYRVKQYNELVRQEEELRKSEIIKLVTKMFVMISLIVLTFLIFHSFIFSVIKSFQYLIAKNGLHVLIMMLLAFVFISFIPLVNGCAMLVSTVFLIQVLFTNNIKEPGSLAMVLLMFLGSWTGFLARIKSR